MDNRGTLECLGCPFFAIPDIGYDIFVCKKRCKSRFQHIIDRLSLLQYRVLVEIADVNIFRPFDLALIRL